MWTKLAHIVIKHRLPLIIILGVITVFMGYHAQRVELSYDFGTTVPEDDPDMIEFKAFKKQFGEDGNIVALGISDSSLYEIDNFRRFSYLTDAIGDIPGVLQVVSISNLNYLHKNTAQKKFELIPVFQEIPDTQQVLDSLLKFEVSQRFYSDQIINVENGATFIAVAIDKNVINSQEREQLMDDLKMLGEAFTEHTNIDLMYVGLPYIRSEVSQQIKTELQTFLLLSLAVTALILFLFFRSWDAVVFPLMIVGVVVIWSLGSLALLDYKITLLTGLLPAIITVIGIPNSIYLLNKYHQEINKHNNKIRALSHIIRKIGLVTLITNFTTAIGFLVLAFADIKILREFGIVAGINIIGAFTVSIILIPAVFSYLPTPHGKQLKHLKFQGLEKSLNVIDALVHRYRTAVYVVTAVLIVLSLVGMSKLQSVSFVVDDIPKDSQIKQDMQFFEKNFSGIMPLEIVVDTGKKRGVLKTKNLNKINQLEDYLAEQPFVSNPISLVTFLKGSKQAFYNNKPDYYQLPSKRERAFIFPYLQSQQGANDFSKAFVDSTQQVMRISFKVADIGSNKLEQFLNNVVNKKIDELFGSDEKVQVKATGTMLLFVKGNSYLVKNLRMSMLLAFLIISIIMGFLFRNPKMIIISVIPNIIPILFTAGLMGFLGIPLKPSTALIFSVAFGISVDDSIHYLAKYRQELFSNNFFVPYAVSKSIRETGTSMMYTSIVLFAGFSIFIYSDFGSTKSLGILTSTTLLIAMFTNLIVLPSLLLTFDDGKRDKDVHPPIEQYDDLYIEGDEETNGQEVSLDSEVDVVSRERTGT